MYFWNDIERFVHIGRVEGLFGIFRKYEMKNSESQAIELGSRCFIFAQGLHRSCCRCWRGNTLSYISSGGGSVCSRRSFSASSARLRLADPRIAPEKFRPGGHCVHRFKVCCGAPLRRLVAEIAGADHLVVIMLRSERRVPRGAAFQHQQIAAQPTEGSFERRSSRKFHLILCISVKKG